jgi:hypothetical protein
LILTQHRCIIKKILSHRGDVDVQVKYLLPLEVDGAVWLGGWARLMLDRRRDLTNDYPNCAAAAQAPHAAQERHYFDNPRNHMRGAYHHSEAA